MTKHKRQHESLLLDEVRFSSPVICSECGGTKSKAALRAVGGVGQIWCRKCFRVNSIRLKFVRDENDVRSIKKFDVLLCQTVNDVLHFEGRSLVPTMAMFNAPDYELVLERTEQPLPLDKTLIETDVKDGDVLIVKEAAGEVTGKKKAKAK